MKLLLSLFILFSCNNSPNETTSSQAAIAQPGDIIVSNITSRKVILFDSDGNFKKNIAVYNPLRDTVYGLSWDIYNDKLLIAINGTPDRIEQYDPYTDTVSTLINNPNLNGNVFDVGVTTDESLLVIESNNVEKFTETGTRVGSPFQAGLMTNLSKISGTSTGGFLACSTGTDRIRTYDETGAQLAEATSAIGGTSNAYACMETSNGNMVGVWNGTTDTIILYNSDFSSIIATYSDTSVLPDPRAISETPDGNFIVSDYNREYLVELDSSLNYVRTILNATLADSWDLEVVPNY